MTNFNAEESIVTEFSRMVDVTTLGVKGRHFKLEASEAERNALAKRFSVQDVNQVKADCSIFPIGKGRFQFEVKLDADLVQSCSVSLMSVPEKISNQFSIILLNESRKLQAQSDEIEFDLEEEDYEIMTSNEIDAGELIAQYLSLEINPYPRSEGATGEELGQKIIPEEEFVEGEEKKNPFEVLKTLKHKS